MKKTTAQEKWRRASHRCVSCARVSATTEVPVVIRISETFTYYSKKSEVASSLRFFLKLKIGFKSTFWPVSLVFFQSNKTHQRSRNDAVARALASHQFDSRTRRHMWVVFFVGSRPCSEGFSPGSLIFLSDFSSKFPRGSNATGL